MSKFEQVSFGSYNTTSSLERKKPKHKINPLKLGRTVLLAAAIAFGADQVIKEVTHMPTFSPENHEYYAEPGDTVWGMTDNIEGINTIDKRIAVDHIYNMPENQDVFKNGQLDAGETLSIPDHVEEP